MRGRNWQQTSNNIEYHSPVIGGFDAQAQYAFGNQSRGFNYGAADDFGRSDGIMISYHSPLLDVRGIYDELRDNNGKFSNIFTASREYFVGANVKVSKFKIQGAHYQAPDSPAVADRADHYWLGATYTATPQWADGRRLLREGGRWRWRCVARSVGHAMMYVLGTTYNPSKRTFLYGTVAYVRNAATRISLLATPRDATSGTAR